MYDRVNNGGVAMQPIEWHFPRKYLDECTYMFIGPVGDVW